MRYRKGSIVISEAHDVPLLLLVRNAGYITHEQLIALSGYDKSQSSVCNFLWRIRRLLAGGFVALLHQRIEGHKVYSITRKGLAELESFGHMLYSLNPETTSIGQPSKMTHCLELNETRLTLERHRLLDSWLSDIEVCSENLLTEDKYVKDYDALAVLRVGDRQLHCAIEYERTTKSLARYSEIRQALSQERTLDAILYIVREVERLFLVAEQLAGAHPGILFVTASAFLRFGPDAYAIRSQSVGGTLEELLVQLASEGRPVRASVTV
jgi:hypothetical protein